jgi:uncharacterized protein YjiS (DUF1127 family)
MMRDYMIHEAQSRAAFGRLSAWVRRVTNWRTRKDLKTLMKMNAYQLKDIGLNHAQLHGLLNLPLSCDLRWELERLGHEAQNIAQFEKEPLPLSQAEGGVTLFARGHVACK